MFIVSLFDEERIHFCHFANKKKFNLVLKVPKIEKIKIK
jgi:hypothetical protein